MRASHVLVRKVQPFVALTGSCGRSPSGSRWLRGLGLENRYWCGFPLARPPCSSPKRPVTPIDTAPTSGCACHTSRKRPPLPKEVRGTAGLSRALCVRKVPRRRKPPTPPVDATRTRSDSRASKQNSLVSRTTRSSTSRLTQRNCEGWWRPTRGFHSLSANTRQSLRCLSTRSRFLKVNTRQSLGCLSACGRFLGRTLGEEHQGASLTG